jgi:hypothetical protein
MGCAAAGACAVVTVAYAEPMGGADFVLPRDVVSAGTAFEGYTNAAARIDGRYSSDAGVARDIRATASYEPVQLEEGMIAYGAIVALQDGGFVDGVEDAAGRGAAREAFAERLIEDPFEATRLAGAEGATRRVEAALSVRAAPLVAAGSQVKAASYTVQHQSWSRAMVANAQDRLAEVKSVSASRIETSEADDQAMMSRVVAFTSHPAIDSPVRRVSGVEARALALAAEAVLGRAESRDRDRLAPLLSESDSAECLRMAKLDLYQCMAVAGPSYEEMYCMGQHAIADTGRCIAAAAGEGEPTRVTAQSAPPAKAHPSRRWRRY